MSTRSHRILNMVLPKTNNSIHPRKQEPDQDLPVPKENKNLPIQLQKHDSHYLFNCEPTLTDLHDDSFDTNSLPDSQIGYDLDNTFNDTNEKDSECPKQPNEVIVEEANSDNYDDCLVTQKDQSLKK